MKAALIAVLLLLGGCATAPAALEQPRPKLNPPELSTIQLKLSKPPVVNSIKVENGRVSMSIKDYNARREAWLQDRARIKELTQMHNEAVQIANIRGKTEQALNDEAGAYDRIRRRDEAAAKEANRHAFWQGLRADLMSILAVVAVVIGH